MPRGMDERFENPSEEEEEEEAASEDETAKTTSEAEKQDSEPTADTEEKADQGDSGTADAESSAEQTTETDDEPLNIREDWDSATIYVEPEQSEDIEVTFTRLKKQLKREDITLEKNKHFYRGIFEVAFDEHAEETKEKIRELAKEDVDQ